MHEQRRTDLFQGQGDHTEIPGRFRRKRKSGLQNRNRSVVAPPMIKISKKIACSAASRGLLATARLLIHPDGMQRALVCPRVNCRSSLSAHAADIGVWTH